MHEAAYFFIERGVGLVVVTRGDGGATAMSKGKRGGGGGRGTGREELGARDEEVGEGETVERDERWKWEQKCADVEVRVWGEGVALLAAGTSPCLYKEKQLNGVIVFAPPRTFDNSR